MIKYGSLYLPFEKKFFWWGVVLVNARRGLLVFFLKMLSEQPVPLSCVCIGIHVLYGLLVLVFEPYEDPKNDTADAADAADAAKESADHWLSRDKLDWLALSTALTQVIVLTMGLVLENGSTEDASSLLSAKDASNPASSDGSTVSIIVICVFCFNVFHHFVTLSYTSATHLQAFLRRLLNGTLLWSCCCCCCIKLCSPSRRRARNAGNSNEGEIQMRENPTFKDTEQQEEEDIEELWHKAETRRHSTRDTSSAPDLR
jgi:hypothetical protein